MKYRTKYIDLDTRRDAKSDFHCYRCLKTIKPSSKYRMVHVVEGGWQALHRDDEALYVPDGGDCGNHPLGMECAKIIGMEFTHTA